MPLVSIEVTPDIAAKIRFMAESGIFAMRGGSATLNFAPNGELKSIKQEVFYNYKTVDNELALRQGVILKASSLVES